MKTFNALALTAIVLTTSACASNAVKPQAAVPSGSLPSSTVVVGAAPAVAPATIDAVPPPAATPGAAGVAQTVAVPAAPDTPVSELARDTDADEQLAQAEPDASDLYAQPSVRDPWEGFNRKIHGFNNVLDRFVLRPVAVGYDKIVPDPVQSGVSRFFANLRLPATAINQALQGRPAHAGQSLGRFVVNSTVGVAGVFDPATRFGMPQRDGEDFGQTLATWGWRDSRYLVMPLMGPRTVRDAVAIVGDQPMSPISQIDKSSVADKLTIMQMVDGRSRLLPMDSIRKDAFDDYAFVRDAWAQHRNHQIEQDLRAPRD